MNVFVKPDEQSRTRAGYAEARKRLMKMNVFDKPSAEPNLFRLCRGEKTTVENKRRMKFNLFGKRERKPSADYAGAEKER